MQPGFGQSCVYVLLWRWGGGDAWAAERLQELLQGCELDMVLVEDGGGRI